ncbi:uncharacterized protein LOC127284374 [Leptopilina boulardi]|uniref:uncharacterized protein LOC127284374 n=1 Tax=Leptopilina boulardi TaxID=63433 RepID=UPI0021F54F83|nr:uncharacterized protein LOC127284374 [Leptopilina boulardi]
MVKQLGRWRSDIKAHGYVEHSMHNRQLIYDGVIQKSSSTKVYTKPSTSVAVPNENQINESNYDISWSDFSKVINPADFHPLLNGVNSITGNKEQIPEPVTNPIKSDNRRSELVSENSGANLNFENHLLVPSLTCGKRNRNKDWDNQTHNEVSANKYSKPLTDAQGIIENEDNCISDLQCSDVLDDFNSGGLNPATSRIVNSGFTTAIKQKSDLSASRNQAQCTRFAR